MTVRNGIMVLSAFTLMMGAAASQAEEVKMDHSKMDHSAMMMAAPTSEGAYGEAMKTMHESMMAVNPTGDADVDFVAGMIPHHQGAIDMAKVVLEKGTDPAIRKLAEGIIKAQESEIVLMQDWLKNHAQK